MGKGEEEEEEKDFLRACSQVPLVASTRAPPLAAMFDPPAKSSVVWSATQFHTFSIYADELLARWSPMKAALHSLLGSPHAFVSAEAPRVPPTVYLVGLSVSVLFRRPSSSLLLIIANSILCKSGDGGWGG